MPLKFKDFILFPCQAQAGSCFLWRLLHRQPASYRTLEEIVEAKESPLLQSPCGSVNCPNATKHDRIYETQYIYIYINHPGRRRLNWRACYHYPVASSCLSPVCWVAVINSTTLLHTAYYTTALQLRSINYAFCKPNSFLLDVVPWSTVVLRYRDQFYPSARKIPCIQNTAAAERRFSRPEQLDSTGPD